MNKRFFSCLVQTFLSSVKVSIEMPQNVFKRKSESTFSMHPQQSHTTIPYRGFELLILCVAFATRIWFYVRTHNHTSIGVFGFCMTETCKFNMHCKKHTACRFVCSSARLNRNIITRLHTAEIERDRET